MLNIHEGEIRWRLDIFGDKDEDSDEFVGLLSNNLRCRMVIKVGPTPF